MLRWEDDQAMDEGVAAIFLIAIAWILGFAGATMVAGWL